MRLPVHIVHTGNGSRFPFRCSASIRRWRYTDAQRTNKKKYCGATKHACEHCFELISVAHIVTNSNYFGILLSRCETSLELKRSGGIFETISLFCFGYGRGQQRLSQQPKEALGRFSDSHESVFGLLSTFMVCFWEIGEASGFGLKIVCPLYVR